MKLEDEWRARRALQTIEGRMCEKIPVRKQAKIITTIYREIQRAVSKDQSFDVIPLISFVSFLNFVVTGAKKKELWRRIVKQVVESAFFC